jgi:hypothetical protein
MKIHKPGDIFKSSILGEEIETVEWTLTDRKDNKRCHVCVLYNECRMKERIEERRKDVGSCSWSSRGDGLSVYFKYANKSETIAPEAPPERNPGDKFFSKLLGCTIEVKGDKVRGRCLSCAYENICEKLSTLRNFETGNCSEIFRDDSSPVYFVKIEEKYKLDKEVYNLLIDLYSSALEENIKPEECRSLQLALLDVEYSKHQ